MKTRAFHKSLCLVAGVILGLLASKATAQACSNSTCQVISLGFRHTTFCGLGAAAIASDASRFTAANFRFTCVGDVSKACDAMDNTLITGDVEYSCCSCYLYAQHCHKAIGKSKFVTNKNLTDTQPHVLLMPSAPCTGVENYNRGQCPQEAIWDEGAGLLDRAHKGAGWGMAINPVSRRSQHQMHVHLAEVFGSLMTAIADVHKAGNATSYVVCAGKQTSSCKPSAKGSDTKDIKVQLFTAPSASKAQPFLHAYGPDLSNKNPLVLWASTLVVRVPQTASTWAVVTNPTGPAECFFKGTTDHCS